MGGAAGFFTPKYTVTVYFPSVNGMNNGAEVWLEGVTVGNVRSVRVTNLPEPERSVAVEMSLDLQFQEIIRSDSIVTIGSIGLLGDSIVEIEKGAGLGDIIPDQGAIQGQQTGDIRALITGTNDIIANLEILSEEIQEIARQIRQGEGTLGKMLTDTSIYDNANANGRGSAPAGGKRTDRGRYDRHSDDRSGTVRSYERSHRANRRNCRKKWRAARERSGSSSTTRRFTTGPTNSSAA